MASDNNKFHQWAARDFEVYADPKKEDAELHMAAAMNFIAFRIGRIDDKLARLIQLLERQQGGK